MYEIQRFHLHLRYSSRKHHYTASKLSKTALKFQSSLDYQSIISTNIKKQENMLFQHLPKLE